MAGPDATQHAAASSDPLRGVTVIDAPESRVHRVSDLLAASLTVLGIVLVLLLGAYGTATTEGLTEDVQGFARVLQRLLVAPVNIFSGIVTIVVPLAVILDLGFRREPRRILEVLGAGVLAFIVTVIAAITTLEFGADELITSLSVRSSEGDMVVQASRLPCRRGRDAHRGRAENHAQGAVDLVAVRMDCRRRRRDLRHRDAARRHHRGVDRPRIGPDAALGRGFHRGPRVWCGAGGRHQARGL
ncbi:hypothetical protein GCM10025876_20300 [Demequina litorisediminis]|uniref:Uncharacterized protein n=1 Tax=Demequina litorisediminis TaxID=1849022 RepID=A0ABQ6IEG8_9MICO|nr:hypothetical protein GCM10025876_20300 [Demequina litorisediminis]